MKIAVIIVRVLIGLLFLFASVSFFLNLVQAPPMHGPFKEFNEGLAASGYMMPLVKSLELIIGIAFVSGYFVPLATAVMFPVSVNIVLVHTFLAPEGIAIALIVFAANLFLAFAYREKYKTVFAVK